MFNLKLKVFNIVKNIKPGKFLTYKQVSELIGNKKAYRVVANILSKNKDPQIPCHRVIRNDNLVGGYFGKENLSWLKAAKLLKEGAIGVIPTDTIYGICTSAFNKKSVSQVYLLRKRNPRKPCIILISDIDDLKRFKVKVSKCQKKFLDYLWPGHLSVILQCDDKNFSYLHRGTYSLAFRLPKNSLILKILKVSGPLIAPSANWEGFSYAKNIKEAKKYFKDKVFYLDKGKLISSPSTLVDLRDNKINILRKGKGIRKILKVLNLMTL